MRPSKPSKTLLVIAAIFTGAAVVAVCALVAGVGSRAIWIALFGLSISLGPCLLAYTLAPIGRKQVMRRLVLFTGGLTILGFSLLTSASLDLEGFFLLLFEGVAGAAIGHTVVTLVLGPVLFGRILCGWGCWRAMVLELLPVGHGNGRHGGAWKAVPFISFAICMVAAAIGFFVLGHHGGGVPGSPYRTGTVALLCGFGIYYLAAIGVAFYFHDQRAFCKYMCPNLPVLRLTSRLALLKVSPRRGLCDRCGACSRVCPMDIDVRGHAIAGTRIGTGQCILCQRCVHVCPKGALTTTLRLN